MTILNVAHRGARSLAPENTIAAALKALEVGAGMWELDVQLTADDELLVMHDPKLTRTSDVGGRFPQRRPWRVDGFALSEIQTMDCGGWFVRQDPFGQIAVGAVSAAETDSYLGLRAPTLRQALEYTIDNGWTVNIELKHLTGDDKGRLMVQKTIDLITALGMEQGVLLSSFNHDYLRQARTLAPNLPIAALSLFAIRRPLRYLTNLGAQAYNPRQGAVRRRMVAALRSSGLDVYVWTVNNEKAMRRLIGMGVTGIITDFPQSLCGLLVGP